MAFESFATNLVAVPDTVLMQVFRYDRETETTVQVSVSSGGVAANQESRVSDISASGRHVVFWTTASNVVVGDTNETTDLFVRDIVAGTTTLVSRTADGSQFETQPTAGVISADGQRVVFGVPTSFMISGVTFDSFELYVRDLQGGDGAIQRIPVGVFDARPKGWVRDLTMSADASILAFESSASNLVPESLGYPCCGYVLDRFPG